jgi:hypothetical protein
VSRSLWPREHGAYAQLGAPLVASLALRTPTVAAVSIALGAVLAFLAHEPLLVVLGHRGKRMRDEAGPRARRWLIALGGAAAASGGAGLVLAPSDARIAALILVAPVAAMLVLAWHRREHTFGGELVGAATLTGAGAPVACASGVGLGVALVVWAAWTIGFATSVVAVHRVLARHRRPATWIDALAASGLLALLVGLSAAAITVDRIWAAPLPLAAVATVVVIGPPPATRLRTVGVILTIAALISTGLLLAAAST